MSALANGTATLAPPPNPAEMFNVIDPPHEYQILVPDPVAPAPPVATVATPAPAPVVQPAGTVTPVQVPAPSAPVATVATPAEPRHPEWLVKAAESQGVHPLVLERLSTQDLNAIVVQTMQRQLAERSAGLAAQTVMAHQHQPAAVGTPAPPAPIQPQGTAPVQATPVQPQAPAFDWGVHPDVDALGNPTAPRQYTDADINPAIAHVVKGLRSEVNDLKRFIATMNKTVEQSAEAKIQTEFDAAFNKYPQVFGQGDGRAVHGKPEFERRRIVYQSVKAMFQTLPPEARAAVTIDGAVQNYTKTLFGADAPVATVATPAPVPTGPGANFVGGAVALPTQRKPAPAVPGREAAIEATAEWWNANKAAGPAGASGDTSLNEFL